MPVLDEKDYTLDRMNKAIEDNYVPDRRGYLGASLIGEECECRIWYDFHWTSKNKFDAKSIKAIQDGYHSEDVMKQRLKATPGIRLRTEGKGTNGQIGFFDGHLGGSVDGLINGLDHNPSATHIWENKCVNQDNFNRLVKLIAADESTALYEWNKRYFGQAQTYMKYFGVQWHYLTCCSAGSRDEIGCLTPYDPDAAKFYIDRANRIINSSRPPGRISANPSWYQCKFCPYSEHCHGDKIADSNCRTCAHSTPDSGGTWSCSLHKSVLNKEVQISGCKDHLFIPDLIPGDQIDAGDGWVEYRRPDGTTVRNEANAIKTVSGRSG